MPYDEYLFFAELLEDYNDSLLVKEAIEDKENREGGITAEKIISDWQSQSLIDKIRKTLSDFPPELLPLMLYA